MYFTIYLGVHVHAVFIHVKMLCEQYIKYILNLMVFLFIVY